MALAGNQMLSWGDIGGGNLTADDFVRLYGNIGKITPSGTYEQYQTHDAENPLVNGRELYYGSSPVYRQTADGAKTLADLMPVYGDKQTWVTGTGGMDGTASGYQTDTSDGNLLGYRLQGGTVHGSGDRWWANYDKDGKFTGFTANPKDPSGFLQNNDGLLKFALAAGGGALAAGLTGATGAAPILSNVGEGALNAAGGAFGYVPSGISGATPGLMSGFVPADAADAYAGYTGPSVPSDPTTIDTLANASNPYGYSLNPVNATAEGAAAEGASPTFQNFAEWQAADMGMPAGSTTVSPSVAMQALANGVPFSTVMKALGSGAGGIAGVLGNVLGSKVGMGLLGAALGAAASSSSSGGTSTSSRTPYGPAQPWINDLITQGQDLSKWQRQNPSNQMQRQAADNYTAAIPQVQGLLDLAGRLGATSYSRQNGSQVGQYTPMQASQYNPIDWSKMFPTYGA